MIHFTTTDGFHIGDEYQNNAIELFHNQGMLDRAFPNLPEVAWQILEMEDNQTIIHTTSSTASLIYLVNARDVVQQLQKLKGRIYAWPATAPQNIITLQLFKVKQPGILRIGENGEVRVIRQQS